MVADNNLRKIYALWNSSVQGSAQIEVTFDIDRGFKRNRKDKATGKEQRITIQGGTGLSKEEVENGKRIGMHDEDKRRKRS